MIKRAHKTLKRFASDTSGTTLTELAIVIPLLLLIVMGTIEFGRLGYNTTMVQQATEYGARTAAVRPPICDGVPDTIAGGSSSTSTTPPKAGSLCKSGGSGTICATVAPVACPLSAPGTSTTARTTAQERADAAQEIWNAISPLLPNRTTADNSITAANVWVRYEQDPRIGFLSGPYTPVVTVEVVQVEDGRLERLDYSFITPLGQLAELAILGGPSGIRNSFKFPVMSSSMPGEDLGNGTGS